MKTYPKIGLAVATLTLFSFIVACNKVETTTVERRNLEEYVFSSGLVEQEDNYTVSAKVEGIIRSLPFSEGDSVQAGEVIAVIENQVQNNQLSDARAVYEDALRDASPNSPRLLGMQTQVRQAEEQLAFDRDLYLRYKELREKNSVSQLDLEKAELQFRASENQLEVQKKNYAELLNSLRLNVERSRAQLQTQETLLDDYELLTGASGVVIKVFKKEGELSKRGEPIARIGSGEFRIRLYVAEEDINKVDLGDPVRVQMNTYPHRSFEARVSKIHPGFDEAEQSYVVEARFRQLPEKLFSGTQLQANIDTGQRDSVLLIPTDYILRGAFVIMEDGEERRIVTGNRNSEWTEVVSGLTGQEVIRKPED